MARSVTGLLRNATRRVLAHYIPAGPSEGVLNESIDAGFTGTGYANVTNATGAFWEITGNLPTAGSYQLDSDRLGRFGTCSAAMMRRSSFRVNSTSDSL
jgi:hypothetical protein